MAGAGIRIGLGVPSGSGADAAVLVALAQEAESLGFDSIWVTDHLDRPALDPIVAVATIAALTRRIRLGTSVMVLPGRNPAAVAKAVASLDRASHGRFLPIVGLGRSRAQSTLVGTSARGAAFEEALALIRRFWSGEAVTVHGEHYSCDGMVVRPTPLRGDVDLWIAGNHPAQQRRAGELSDGWLGVHLSAREAGVARDRVLVAAAAAGRNVDRDHFGMVIRYGPVDDPATAVPRRPDLPPHEILATDPDQLAALLARYASAGIHKFVLLPTVGSPPLEDLLATWQTDVLPLQVEIDADLDREPGVEPSDARP